MVEYFAGRSDKMCDESVNPAEYMLDVIADPPLGDESDWHQVYLQSQLQKTLQSDMTEICSRQHQEPIKNGNNNPAHEFAAPFWEQFRVLMKRTKLHFWRSPN